MHMWTSYIHRGPPWFLGKLRFPGKVKEGGMAANLFLTGDLTILASCHF